MEYKIDSKNVYIEFNSNNKHYKEFDAEVALAILLIEQKVFTNDYWHKNDWPWEAKQKTNLHVLCNDTFAWGTADSEDLDYSEIEDVWKHFEKDPDYGPIIWCIKKRKEMPQAPVREDIVADGIWNLEEMGLEPNHYDKIVKEKYGK